MTEKESNNDSGSYTYNGKSISWLQVLIVECGPYETCEPIGPSDDVGYGCFLVLDFSVPNVIFLQAYEFSG